MKMALWMLNCYPRRWRERYGEEMLALLEQHRITPKTVIDLFLGALDARLNSVYRSKGGLMLQNIRDNRTLALIYFCALAVFLLANTFWYLLIFLTVPFTFGGVTATILASPLVNVIATLIPVVTLIALSGVVGVILGKTFKRVQWGTVTFALICLGVTFCLIWFFPALVSVPRIGNISDINQIANLNGWQVALQEAILDAVVPALLFGGGLFLTGVKALKLLREHRHLPILFALLVGLLAPASYVIFSWLWSWSHNPTQAPLSEWLLMCCWVSGVYLALSGLLLTLATSTVTKRGWQTARMWGALLTILLLGRLISIVVWDVFRWIEGGGVWIFDPLLIHALLLVIALALMVLALLRSFVLPAEESLPTPASA